MGYILGRCMTGCGNPAIPVWCILVVLSCLPEFPCTSVNITSGTVTGTTLSGVNVFLGIPYAAPPVGSGRWAPPRSLSGVMAAFNATSRPPFCPQPLPNSWVSNANAVSREDCLHLNIYAPNSTEEGPYPVLVFLHGGGWRYGGASSYDGSSLAARGVVVVVPNYRLGPLGFLMSRGGTFASNLGLRDQVEALKWVHKNIAAFGGDLSNIVLAGHETGAESVTMLMTSPLSKGLFHRAIAMGAVGPFGEHAWDNPTRWKNEAIESMAELMGCRRGTIAKHLVCLRKVSAHKIVAANVPTGVSNPLHQWRPQVGGRDFPDFMESWQSGKVAQIPLIIGNDAVLDLTDVPLRDDEVMTATTYNKALIKILSWAYPQDLVPIILDMVHFSYREWATPYMSPYLARYINQMLGDMVNTGVSKACHLYSQQIDKETNASIFRYVFSYRSPAMTVAMQPGQYRSTETPWASVSLLFGQGMAMVDNSTWSRSDTELSRLMATLWLGFIKNGRPENVDEGIYWPAYNHTTQMYLMIGSMKASSYYRQRQVFFWDSLRRSLANKVAAIRESGEVEGKKMDTRSYYVATWVLLSLCALSLILVIFLIAFMIHKSSDDYDMSATPTVKYVAK